MVSATFEDFDDTERAIAERLRADGRASTVQMANEIGVAEATVRRKLQNLLSDKSIHVQLVSDPTRGSGVTALVGFIVEITQTDEVAKKLATYDFVESVYVMTGPYHLIAEVRAPSTDHLFKFLMDDLKPVAGIKNTESYIVGRVYKHHGRVTEVARPNVKSEK
jgi:Lrp/AsnC family transcriptional regulator for asnA, asnC and gidA